MDLETVCKEIIATIYDFTKDNEAPVADVTLRVGRNWQFSDYETSECFNKEKWNSSVSNADLIIIHDDTMQALYKIDNISDFADM